MEKIRYLPLKNKHESVFLYHATEGVIVVNPDQVDCYMEQGWRDTPVSIQELEQEAEALRKELTETEAAPKKRSRPTKEESPHEESKKNAS